MKAKKRFVRILAALAFAAAILAAPTSAQEPTWQSAFRYGAGGADAATATAFDPNGNRLYACGRFSGSSPFASTTLNSAGSTDIFVARFTGQGQAVWAKRAGGTAADEATAIAVAPGGDVYVAGTFRGTITFESLQLVSVGQRDVFLAKYSSEGVLEWVRRAGGPGDDVAEAITIAGSNIFMAGAFVDSAQFGSLPMLRTPGKNDLFVACYNSSGAEQWARRGGTVNRAAGRAIAATATAVYVAASFTDTLKQAANIVSRPGNDDIALLKYNNAGTFQTATRWGSGGSDIPAEIKLDGANKLLMAGFFTGDTLQFGATRLLQAGAGDAFIAKMDTNGVAEWAARIGSNAADAATGITIAPNDAVCATGFFSASTSIGTVNLTTAGAADVFVARYSAAGTLEWVKTAGGTDNDYAYGIAAGTSAENYVVGGFYYQAKFDQHTLDGAGEHDAFVARLSQVTGLDAGVAAVVFPAAPFPAASQTISVVLKNYGTQTIDSVRINWNFNGVAQNQIRHTTAIAPGATATVQLGNMNFPPAFLSTVTAGTQFPNGMADPIEANDARTAKAGPGLTTGIYTVGGNNPTFAVIAQATEYLRIAGVLGRPTFRIRAGNYDERLAIANVPGLRGENTRIIFEKDSASATKPLVRFAAVYPNNNAALDVDAASWLTFRNIAFTASGNGIYRQAARLANSPRALRFELCDFTAATGGAANSDDVFTSLAGSNPDSLRIAFCSFNGGSRSLAVRGSAARVKRLQIIGCRAAGFAAGGIFVQNAEAPMLADNVIETASSVAEGMTLDNASAASRVTGNIVRTMPAGIGFAFRTVTANMAAPALIANNMAAVGSASAAAQPAIFTNCRNLKIYHNTWHNASASSAHEAMHIGGGDSLDLLNNIAYNSGGGRALTVEFTAPYPVRRSDFNNLYTNGPALALRFDGLTRDTSFTLQQLRNATGNEINSVSKLTAFAADNLHLTVVDSALFGTTTIRADVADDVDKQERRTVYRGADEIIPVIAIARQPEKQVRCAGEIIIIETDATITNAGKLHFQWQRNKQDIADSNRKILTITNATDADNGFYRCIITGNSGADTVYTLEAQLIVTTNTLILREPRDAYLLQGDNATFDVLAEAAPILPQNNVIYQWYRDSVLLQNSTRIAGQGTSMLRIFNVQPADTSRQYRVVVRGACGADTSRRFALLLPGAAFQLQPLNVRECLGSTAILTTSMRSNISNPTYEYQWRKGTAAVVNNGRISGANTPTLTITALADADTADDYSLQVRVVELNTVIVSDVVSIKIKNETRITAPPVAVRACPGKPFALSAAAAGENLRYQWQKDGVNVAGATAASYSVAAADSQSTGKYRLVATGDCGTVTSAEAEVTFVNPASILSQPPAKVVVNIGQQLIIRVVAAGEIPLAFQWYKNGQIIAGSVLNPFLLNNAQASDSGTYHCVVKNICDSVVSQSTKAYVVPVGVDDQDAALAVGSAHPNPFADRTAITFAAQAGQTARITIVDAIGRIVAALPETVCVQGANTANFSAKAYSLPAGAYTAVAAVDGLRIAVPIIVAE